MHLKINNGPTCLDNQSEGGGGAEHRLPAHRQALVRIQVQTRDWTQGNIMK